MKEEYLIHVESIVNGSSLKTFYGLIFEDDVCVQAADSIKVLVLGKSKEEVNNICIRDGFVLMTLDEYRIKIREANVK